GSVLQPLREPFSNALFTHGVCPRADQGIENLDIESQPRAGRFFYREDLELGGFEARQGRKVSLDLRQKPVTTRQRRTRKLAPNHFDSVLRTYRDLLGWPQSSAFD